MFPSERLVQAIEQKMLLSPAVRRAFLEIDRRLFVPSYYIRVGGEWIQQDAGDMVYEDKALTTLVDQNGTPISSSSQPSIMAAMLDALSLDRGQRVLEIGVGTGYNAALLARLVGDPHLVTSIDIDPHLVQQAKVTLRHTVGDGMTLVVGNGVDGYSLNAPYDRLIATASSQYVPPSWVEQLASGGVLVMNLIGPFTSVLVRLVKQPDGRLEGITLPLNARFMELQSSVSPDRSWMAENWAIDELSQVCDDQDTIKLLREEQALIFYLQSALPSLRIRLQYCDGPKQRFTSYAICYWSDTFLLAVHHDRVTARGVWQELFTWYRRWAEERPGLGAYRVCVNNEGKARFYRLASSAIERDS